MTPSPVGIAHGRPPPDRAESAQPALPVSATAKIRAELLKHRITSERTMVTKIDTQHPSPWKPKVLVLSGGGAKGFALPGAFHVLQQTGMLSNIVTVAGTSIGGLFGALLVCGFSAAELAREACTTQFGPLSDFSLKHLAMHNSFIGDKWLRSWIAYLIASKLGDESTDITLAQLHALTHKELILCAYCIETAQVVYLSATSHPELPLVTAILMTCAIPFVFPSVLYEGREYIDGAVQDNYMLGRFDPAVTLGIRLTLRELDVVLAHATPGPTLTPESPAQKSAILPAVFARLGKTMVALRNAANVADRIKALLFASSLEFERTSLYPSQYEIQIDTRHVDSATFEISVEERAAMLEEGARAAAEFVGDPRPTRTGCGFRREWSL